VPERVIKRHASQALHVPAMVAVDRRVDYEQVDGAVGLVIRLFNRIERWASASDDRARLVTILLCARIAVLVLLVFAVFVSFALLQGPAPA
jgi:hypothetical protein